MIKQQTMGLFGKLTHSVSKSFSKISHGSHKAFSKIDHAAHIASEGNATTAHTVQVVARKSGNTLERIGAAVSVINPTIGAGPMGLGASANMLSTGAGMASQGASAFAPNSRRAITGAANAVRNDVRHSFS
jgi:hypothetical protein